MASIYISEFQQVAAQPGQAPIQAAMQPAVTDQAPVAIAAGSAQSAAFNALTNLVRVHTDAICSIAIGVNPVATAATARMAAGQTEYFGVVPGQKLAVITNV